MSKASLYHSKNAALLLFDEREFLVHKNYLALPPNIMLFIYEVPYFFINCVYQSLAIRVELSNGRFYTTFSKSSENVTKHPSKVIFVVAISMW
jgi:hypothetical protein